MKELLLCLLLVLFVGFYASAQVNLIQNGDMEEQGAWKVSQGNLSDTITYDFGSTDYTVDGGDGGNLDISVKAIGTDNTNLTVYQALDLVAGKEYLWSCAMRDLSIDHACWWIKYVWIALEPVGGTDPDEEDIAVMHEWLDGKIYGFNGLFDTCTAAIAAESKDNTFVPEANGTYYIGINMGTCDNTGTYHFVIDEVAMIDQDAGTSINSQFADIGNTLKLHPNPATNIIDFTFTISNYGDVELSLIDILGHQVASLSIASLDEGTYTESFHCSSLTEGMYYGILRANKTIVTKKAIIVK